MFLLKISDYSLIIGEIFLSRIQSEILLLIYLNKVRTVSVRHVKIDMKLFGLFALEPLLPIEQDMSLCVKRGEQKGHSIRGQSLRTRTHFGRMHTHEHTHTHIHFAMLCMRSVHCYVRLFTKTHSDRRTGGPDLVR